MSNQKENGAKQLELKKLKNYINQFMVSGKGVYHTHTIFATPGGKFNIQDENLNKFIELYSDCLGSSELYFVERPKPVGPFLLDIDFNTTIDKREYTDNHIENIIKITNKVISELYETDENMLRSFVMEKSLPTDKLNGNEYKDGFHILYPFVAASENMRYLITHEIKTKCIKQKVLYGINYTNSIDKIFDMSVIKSNGWMMYGSRKFDSQIYKLTKIYNMNCDKIYTIGDKKQLYRNRDLVSILSNRKFNENDELKLNRNIRRNDLDKKLKNVLIQYRILPNEKIGKNIITKTTNNQQKNVKSNSKNIGKIVDDISNECIFNNIDTSEIQQLVDMLNPNRADNYDDWIKLGYCLHNIDLSLINIWVTFSKLNPNKFKEGECELLWEKMIKKNGLGIGTLKMWVKNDKSNELKKLHENFKFEHTNYFSATYFESLDEYDLQKKYFEIFCCKVMRPKPIYVYIEINEEKGALETCYYTESKLLETFRHLPNKFINKWLKDCSIKLYNNLIFKPFNGVKDNQPNNNTFNTFSGYNPNIKTSVTNDTIIKDWCDVVLQLCEGNQKYYDYYIKFLAHIIQYPSERTGMSILFRSNEGVGKGSHLNAIKNIITKKYYFASPSKDDFTGKHALAFANTLLVIWDETGSCADVIDQIKSKITEEYVVIERKGIDKAEYLNFARIIFCTNNLCSLPISDSSRRFVIFQCTDYYINISKNDPTFWNRFHETINKPEFIAALYNYLNNIDLKNWDYKDFPKTNAFNQMKSLYIPSETMFLIDQISKLKADVKIKGTKLYNDYGIYVNANKLDQKHAVNIKEFYAKLENLKNGGINGIKRITMMGGAIGYSLDYNEIIKSLVSKNYIEDPEKYSFIEDDKETTYSDDN